MNVDREITELLLSGEAATASQAEELFLDRHLRDVLELAASPLSESEFRNHPLIRLLLARGSRPLEDSLA